MVNKNVQGAAASQVEVKTKKIQYRRFSNDEEKRAGRAALRS
jgi:hypothetical protein